MASISPVPSTVRAPALQPQTADNGPPSSPTILMNSDTVTTICIIGAVVVSFIIAFQLYARLYYWRRHPRLPATSVRPAGNMPSHADGLPKLGLDKAMVDSLPTFAYRAPPPLQEGAAQLQTGAGTIVELYCAVCLIEFQENDACRLLPKCRHSFHTDCIDMWFLSHSTCPLCRMTALPEESNGGPQKVEEVTIAFPPHQDLEDHIQISDSRTSDRLLPHQNTNGQECMQLGLSDCSYRAGSLGCSAGAMAFNQYERRIRRLERTQSSSMNARHDLLGEDMSEHFARPQTGFPNWQRSVSERSLNVRPSLQSAADVGFRGSSSHRISTLQTDLHQDERRSLPHSSVDVQRPQGEINLTPLLALSSPAQYNAFL